MTGKDPLVSIGMPVRNGGRYLGEAISSLLGQEFGDFELVISDNASEDSTEEICRTFARSDRRITYERIGEDAGANANFNRVLSLAVAPHFMWAAHDDRWDPRFISRCVASLQGNGEAVSCATGIQFIDAFGQPTGLVQEGAELNSPCWTTRVAAIIARHDGHIGFGFYGLHRTSALRRVSPLGFDFGADVLLTLRLAKLGPWCWVPEPLFQYRVQAKPGSGELAWPPTADTASHPVSQLAATVWRELGTCSPGRRATIAARSRFVLALLHLDGGWRTFLLKENGNLVRSAIAGRDPVGVVRHGLMRLVLDPFSPVRRKNWDAARQAGGIPIDTRTSHGCSKTRDTSRCR
ncbi:MAG: glycosyltransferase [Actinomycetota bacterium]